MGSGFSKMKKQAKEMQKQYEVMQEKLDQLEKTGSAANGLVTIILNGHKQIKKIKIDPSCVDPSDTEGLEDLIKAAHMDALKQIEQEESNLSPNQLSF